MTYTGTVQNGIIVVENGAPIPDGTRVEIRVLERPKGTHHPDVLRYGGVVESDKPVSEDEYYAYIWKKHE